MREGGRDSPQRSPTQTLVPSGSMATALVEPHARPSGKVPQFSMERYGFGRELVGALVCAKLRPPIASIARRPIPSEWRRCDDMTAFSLVPLVLRFRSSPHIAAASMRTSETKEH